MRRYLQDNTGSDDELQHLMVPGTKISDYWLAQLRRLTHPVARQYIQQLVPDNEIGCVHSCVCVCVARQRPHRPTRLLHSLSVHSRRYKFTGDAGFFKQALEQKKAQPEAVVLICNGEFHETFGVDALMLMAYVGLRPMRGEALAGSPTTNVQQTCNDLTGAGLTVAVCEQDPTASATKKKRDLIPRVLKQIVSPARRMYLNDMTMRDDDISFPENQPFVGLQRTATGYTMCQVHMDERYVVWKDVRALLFSCSCTLRLPVVVPWLVPWSSRGWSRSSVVVAEGLTQEAVRVMIAGSGCVEPIYVADTSHTDWLRPLATESLGGDVAAGYFPDMVLRKIARKMVMDVKDFRTIPWVATGRPRPVHVATALQVCVWCVVCGVLRTLPRAALSLVARRHLSQPPHNAASRRHRSVC